MRKAVLGSLFCSVFFVAACSDDEADRKKKIDYAAFDAAAVTQMVDDGNYAQALEILRGQEDLGIADLDDYLTLTRIFLELQNGIAAEVAIEKAIEKGADAKELALESARALFLQNRQSDARRKLDEGHFDGVELAEAQLLWGDIASSDGRTDEARVYYHAAIEANAADFRGHLALALLELAQGNLDKAEASADAAANLAGDNGLVSYARGMVDRYQGQDAEAEGHLKKAVELQPSNLMAHLELTGVYIDEGKTEHAQKELDIIYGIAPEHAMAHYYTALMQAQGGDLAKAEALLLRTGDLTKTYPPAARTYGLVAYQLRKYSTAEPYLERFLAVVPADRLVRLALAECLTYRGKAVDALARLQPLLDPAQGDQEAFLQAAAAAAAAGDLQAARGYFEAADTMSPLEGAETPARRRLLAAKIALAQYLSGDEEGAKSRLEAYYKDSVESDEAGLITLANMQLRASDMAGAEKTAGRIIEASPDSAAGYNILGAVRFRQRDLEAAIAAYDKALTLNPDYESALKNRGLAYLSAGKFPEARNDLSRLAKTAPNDGQVQAMLGRVMLELKRPTDALPHLKQARTAIPGSAVVATDYAEALAGTGLTASAIEQAREALGLAKGRTDLEDYINDLLAGWEKSENERKEAERLVRDKVREEAVKLREAREKEAAERAQAAREKAEREKAEREKAEQEKAEQEKAAAETSGDSPADDADKPNDSRP